MKPVIKIWGWREMAAPKQGHEPGSGGTSATGNHCQAMWLEDTGLCVIVICEVYSRALEVPNKCNYQYNTRLPSLNTWQLVSGVGFDWADYNMPEDFNKVHPKLKFNIEQQTSNKINYLDLSITKYQNNLEFEIYRKPTTTDLILHNTSRQPFEHKYQP
jgi:hypothetical protein